MGRDAFKVEYGIWGPHYSNHSSSVFSRFVLKTKKEKKYYNRGFPGNTSSQSKSTNGSTTCTAALANYAVSTASTEGIEMVSVKLCGFDLV